MAARVVLGNKDGLKSCTKCAALGHDLDRILQHVRGICARNELLEQTPMGLSKRNLTNKNIARAARKNRRISNWTSLASRPSPPREIANSIIKKKKYKCSKCRKAFPRFERLKHHTRRRHNIFRDVPDEIKPIPRSRNLDVRTRNYVVPTNVPVMQQLLCELKLSLES